MNGPHATKTDKDASAESAGVPLSPHGLLPPVVALGVCVMDQGLKSGMNSDQFCLAEAKPTCPPFEFTTVAVVTRESEFTA
jgi:hypothetical protein